MTKEIIIEKISHLVLDSVNIREEVYTIIEQAYQAGYDNRMMEEIGTNKKYDIHESN